MPQPNEGTLYFGYGSNLWKSQMLSRCPTSEYLGIARLDNYRWIINDRGYANVVSTVNGTTSKEVVWGLVYRLQKSDEEHLDINEGVPFAYTKHHLPISFWSAPANLSNPPQTTEMLVYIDLNRTNLTEPKEEYIYRMNEGIKDALVEGVPEEYVRDVLRQLIPAESNGEVEELARRQAVLFQEEG